MRSGRVTRTHTALHPYTRCGRAGEQTCGGCPFWVTLVFTPALESAWEQCPSQAPWSQSHSDPVGVHGKARDRTSTSTRVPVAVHAAWPRPAPRRRTSGVRAAGWGGLQLYRPYGPRPSTLRPRSRALSKLRCDNEALCDNQKGLFVIARVRDNAPRGWLSHACAITHGGLGYRTAVR